MSSQRRASPSTPRAAAPPRGNPTFPSRGYTPAAPVAQRPRRPSIPMQPMPLLPDTSASPVFTPLAVPVGNAGSPTEFMLTHLMQTNTQMTTQMSQVVTAVAVMQANLQNIDRRSLASEDEVRKRLDELEHARSADLARLGDLRVDTVERVARTREDGAEATQGAVRTQMERTISVSQALLLMGASILLNLVISVVSRMVHFG